MEHAESAGRDGRPPHVRPGMRSPRVMLAWAADEVVDANVDEWHFLGVTCTMGRSQASGLVTRLSPTEIEFTATVTAASFDRRLPMPGSHAVVWRGAAAHAALFRADVSDVQVLDALEALGAKPGDALGMATWDDRKDA